MAASKVSFRFGWLRKFRSWAGPGGKLPQSAPRNRCLLELHLHRLRRISSILKKLSGNEVHPRTFVLNAEREQSEVAATIPCQDKQKSSSKSFKKRASERTSTKYGTTPYADRGQGSTEIKLEWGPHSRRPPTKLSRLSHGPATIKGGTPAMEGLTSPVPQRGGKRPTFGAQNQGRRLRRAFSSVALGATRYNLATSTPRGRRGFLLAERL